MPVCPACAFDPHPGSRFCGRCGAAIAPMPAPAVQGLGQYAHLRGIGGWLFLLAFSLAVSPIVVAGDAVRTLPTLSNKDGLFAIGILALYFLRNVVTFAALLLLNWLFYNRKRVFPRAMIGYFVWIVGTRLLEALFLFGAPEGRRAIPRLLILPIVSALIWVPYLLVSRRVKGTFIF